MPHSTISTAKIRYPATFLGLFLIVLSVGTAINRRNAQAAKIDRRLASTSSARAQAVQNEFEKASTAALLLSRNTAFSEYSEADYLSRIKPLAAQEVERLVRNRIRSESTLRYLESLFTGRVGEACLVNGLGRELAKVVSGRVSPPNELSVEGIPTQFLQPALALRSGEVHQSGPSISTDTNIWVVGHSTPLPFLHNSKAVLHFEVSLQSYGERLHSTADESNVKVQLVDRATGAIVVGSDGTLFPKPPASKNSERNENLTPYFWLTPQEHPIGVFTRGNRRLSVNQIDQGPNNQNNWLVVTSGPYLGSPFSISAMAGLPIWLALSGFAALFGGLLASQIYVGYQQRAANSDALTGLANRRQLTETLISVSPASTVYAAVIVDLDRFKEVNDVYGHDTGDALLVAVSQRLTDHIPTTDLAFRLGGDEFAVILQSQQTEDELITQARALHEQLVRPYLINGLRIDIEASLGVAIGSPESISGAELLLRADQTMYTAKKLHQGIAVFQIGPESRGQQQLVMLGELRRAIEEHQLVVYYQPKISFATGEIHSMEALVRWQHPSRGLLAPGAFIEFAEETSLIHPLTLEVLDLTLRQIRRWNSAGEEVKVAINISTRSLLDDEFIPALLKLLAHHQCQPSVLQFEITESTLMHDPDRALQLLARIHDLGIEISIDDFGTGYSSLAHLIDLKAQELKIDRAFVSRMTTDPASASVVQSIIALGHNLGMRVVAEGVEDHATARDLCLAGCDIGQGYLWSKPVPAVAAFDARGECSVHFSLIGV